MNGIIDFIHNCPPKPPLEQPLQKHGIVASADVYFVIPLELYNGLDEQPIGVVDFP